MAIEFTLISIFFITMAIQNSVNIIVMIIWEYYLVMFVNKSKFIGLMNK